MDMNRYHRFIVTGMTLISLLFCSDAQGMQPLTNITDVIIFGASISDGIADHQQETIKEEFLQTYGLDVGVTNYTVGGRGVVQALADWENIKTNWTGTNALVVIHTLGNDVSDYRPWSTMSQTIKDELYDAASNLVESISNNGNIPLLVNTTFRNYDGTTINNEDVGSLPFNDNIINPIAATLDPVMVTNGAPFIDPYDFTRNRNTSFQNSDGIHYTQQGYGIMRRFWVENIARRILGQEPYTEARIEDPSSPITSPQKTLIHFDLMDTGDSWYIFGAHQFAGSQTTLNQSLTPLDGYDVNSITASLDSGPVSANHNSNALDTGDTSKTLTNDTVKNFCIRTSSNTWVNAMTFSGFDAGQSVDISIAAYKNASGTGSIGEYTVDGGTNIITLDASLDNSGSHIVAIPSTADSSGTITLQFRAQAGSGYAYLNGILLEPQTADGAPLAAGAPFPANTAADVSTNSIISWTAGSGATSHDVYFGTNSSLTGTDLQTNQTATTYEPGALTESTTYFWRIDEVNGFGTTTGSVWSFTTVSPTNTAPAISTVGYWRFEGGSAGSEISTAASEVNSPSMDGEQWSSNATNVLYSSDVPGSYIYDPVTTQYTANAGSMLAPGTTNNANSQILVNDMSVLDGSWTLEMFVKIEEDGAAADLLASAGNRLFNLDGSTSCYGGIGANSSGSSTLLQFRLGSTIYDYSSNFEDGAWHHLAYVVNYDSGTDTTTTELFRDYTSVGTGTYAGQFTSQSYQDLRFGISSAVNVANIDWFLDDVRLSDGALATNEFLQATSDEPADTTPPAAPAGLTATAGDSTVSLDWNDNAESDLDSYTLYRSTTSGSGYSAIASNLIVSAYEDSAVNDTTYYYVVTATDTSTNESSYSDQVSATPVSDTPPATVEALGYWRFEEGTDGSDIATATDSSTNGYDAVNWTGNEVTGKYSSVVGGTYVYDPVADTYSPNTLSFLAPAGTAGSDDTHISAETITPAITMDGWTFEMFIKTPTNLASSWTRIGNIDGSARWNLNATSSSLNYRMDTSTDSSDTTVTKYNNPTEDGEWHHVAYTVDYDGASTTTIEMFFDYVSAGSVQVDGQFLPSTSGNTALRFGRDSGTDGDGDEDWYFDEARLSASVLATNQFLQLTDTVPTATNNALTNITHVIIFGASVDEGISLHCGEMMAQEFHDTYGLDLIVTNFTEGGRRVHEGLAAWEAAKTNWTGVNALVVMQPIGNDVQACHPWEDMDQATRDAIYSDTSNLVASVKANGNIPMLINTTFRNYDGTTITNEAFGSLPFNENITIPIASTLDPVMVTNGVPFLNPYEFTRNRNTSFQNTDGIHYKQQGYGILRRYWMENIARRIKGQAPFTEARIENPTSPTTSPYKALVHFNVNEDTGDSWHIFGAHQFLGTTTVMNEGLTPFEGYEVNSVQASFVKDYVSCSHNDNALDTGDTTRTLSNDTVKNYYVRTASNTWMTAMSFSGFYAGQTVDISIAAYKDASGTGSIGEYTTDGGTTVQTLDASNDNTDSHILSFSSTADSSGTITLQFRAQDGSDYAYLNGILLDPQEEDGVPVAAGSPYPADTAIDVSANVTLSWVAGSGAASHNVYFGTDSSLTGADLQTNQTATTYTPGVLDETTTYFWRIDEVNGFGTTTGSVWSFTTAAQTNEGSSASTVAYWCFEGGTSGSEISTAASEVNSPAMDGEQWSSNATNVLYSSEVPGAYIYDPATAQYSTNAGSMLSPASTSTDNSQIVAHNMSVLTNGSFTLEMFVKVEDNGGAANFDASRVNRLFNLDGIPACNGVISTGTGGDSVLRFKINDEIYDYTSYTAFQDGLWHHLAYVADYDEGSNTTALRLYRDAVEVKSGSYAGKFTGTSDLRFGVSSSTLSDFDWFLDDVRLSDGVLETNLFLQASDEADVTPPTFTNYPIDEVTHVIFFGASITEGIALNGTVDNMIAQEFHDTYGLDLIVTNFTQGGREVAEGLAAWEVAKTNWTGTKALVVIHPIANNMLHNGVWSELDQATKDEFFNDTSNLVESVKNNGNIPMLVNTAFVNYSGETLSYDTSVLTNEVLGTLPYNENIIDVIAPTLDPVMVTNGTTFLEMYNFTRNRNTSIQTTDGIHYTQQGYSILRRYWVENIARRILGQAPYQESRIENPSSPTSSVQPALIHFTTFEGSGYSWNVFGAHQFMTSKAMTDEGLTPLEGYEANSVLASFDPTPVSGGHNSKVFDTGDTTTTLANDTVKNYYIRTTSNTWVNAMTFSGFDAGQAVDLSITAYKNATGTGSIGEYTTDGGVTIATLDASLDNSGSHVLTIPSTADESGTISLDFRVQEGSGYGYLSGIMIEPQAFSPTITATMSGGNAFIMSWSGGGSYSVLTNADLTNTNGWGVLTSGTSPITNAIGGESQLFYKLQTP